MSKIDEAHIIKDQEQLADLFGETHPLAVDKCLPYLDIHAMDFISRSPFLCIGTQGKDGTSDVSPRGDPAGFVKAISKNMLIIPDRPGNNRLDTMTNIVNTSAVGLLFIIPGFDDTLRINGTAGITTDPSILSQLSLNGRPPNVAIIVDVQEVFLHCAKAFKRSRLWHPDSIQNRADMPSLGQMILEQTTKNRLSEEEVSQVDTAIESDYRDRLY